jgi:hypothetical protein
MPVSWKAQHALGNTAFQQTSTLMRKGHYMKAASADLAASGKTAIPKIRRVHMGSNFGFSHWLFLSVSAFNHRTSIYIWSSVSTHVFSAHVEKKKKSYAGLVGRLQEGHGPFCNPSTRKLRERLLSPGKPGLVASTMSLTRERWVCISPTHPLM